MNRFVVACALTAAAATSAAAVEDEFVDVRFLLRYLPGIDHQSDDLNPTAGDWETDAQPSFGGAVQIAGARWKSSHWGVAAHLQFGYNRFAGDFEGDVFHYNAYAIGIGIGPALRLNDNHHLEFKVVGNFGLGENADVKLTDATLGEVGNRSYGTYHDYGLTASWHYQLDEAGDVILGAELGLMKGFGRTEYGFSDGIATLRDNFAGATLGVSIGTRF
jgi:hypothetical protein